MLASRMFLRAAHRYVLKLARCAAVCATAATSTTTPVSLCRYTWWSSGSSAPPPCARSAVSSRRSISTSTHALLKFSS